MTILIFRLRNRFVCIGRYIWIKREVMREMKQFKLFLTTVLLVILFGSTYVSAQTLLLEYDGGTHEYNGEIYALVINNKVINPPLSPIIFNDRALVPVREIFEEVGANVNYINDTQTVEVSSDDYDVVMRINDNVAYINGAKTNIPDNVVPKLIAKAGGETKTMVPVRFISETIGLDVEFNSEDGAILIASDGYTISDENQAPSVDEVVTKPEENQDKPTVRDAHITSVTYKVTGDNSVRITVLSDSEMLSFSDFTLSSPERVVVDFNGMSFGGVADVLNVASAGVTTLRMGSNVERARIVADVSNLKKYTVEKSADDTVVINIETKPAVVSTPTPTQKSSENTSSVSSDSKLIVLDAGHGGTDPGAIGYLNGNEVLEKNLTLEITYKVKEILENAGYSVSMTRSGDTLPSLVDRPTQANAENAAVFVSIHINSVDSVPDANGTEVFYASSNNGSEYGTTSEKLATNILNRMLYYMGSTNRGVKTAEHAVTKRCEMPAALAEVGFITNPTEVYNMTTSEYQYKAAQGIAEGIMITLKDVKVPQN